MKDVNNPDSLELLLEHRADSNKKAKLHSIMLLNLIPYNLFQLF